MEGLQTTALGNNNLSIAAREEERKEHKAERKGMEEGRTHLLHIYILQST